MCAECFVEFVRSPPGTPVPAALLEVDDAGNWAVPWPPVSDEEAGAAVPSATASEAADPQGLLAFSGCEGVLAEEETADAGAVSCSGCEGDFAAEARGMSVAGGMPLSWKWRKKLVEWINITISGSDGDVAEETEILLPLHAGSTGVSLQRLSGQDGLMQAIDNTTTTAVAAETHILTRTRRPCFGLWSCWFVLASVVLAPLEVVATGRALTPGEAEVDH